MLVYTSCTGAAECVCEDEGNPREGLDLAQA